MGASDQAAAAIGCSDRRTPGQFPFPLYFEPNGLLPWGGSIDGDFFFWETSELIDRWPVVVIRRHSEEPERHDMPMTRFLAGVLGGQLKSPVFPVDYRSIGGPRFEPTG